MAFIPLQPPASLDVEGLRKFGEDQDREIARAWTEVDASLRSLDTRMGAAEANLLTKVGKSEATPSSCRLYGITSTQLRFDPFNGNVVKIAGTLYSVPAAGITVSNGGLSANTVYYVYLTAAGVLEFSTTGIAVDAATAGNIGTVIKSGDPTRSLVGMIRTGASGEFINSATKRFVATWFNRYTRPLQKFTNTYSTASSSFSEYGAGAERLEWLTWGDDAVWLAYGVSIDLADNGVSGGISYTQHAVDGSLMGGNTVCYSGTVGNFYAHVTQVWAEVYAQGYHHSEIFWASGAAGYTTTSVGAPIMTGMVNI